jgi:ribonucleoside-diphosphate reductase alpha chain
MSIKELQKYTAVSKYARWIESEKRRETWDESVDRIKDMMIEVNPSLHKDIEKYYGMIKNQKILGSQRALQFGGKPILKHNARIFNCSASYCDRLKFFQECFYLLLCGSGTGFSVQKHHVELLPKFSSTRLDPETCCYQHLIHRVEDSIEGWADALGVLLSSYFETPIKEFEKYKDIEVGFSYVDIREKGSPLGCGIGNAPGYEPLEKALENTRDLLNRCTANGQTELRTIDAFDIVMYAADAVISGGVRRSATIALFSADDELMINAKTGDWYFTNPQRARANISALLHRKDTSKEVFENLFKATKEFGEPGFFFADYYDVLCNPCCEISWITRHFYKKGSPELDEALSLYEGPKTTKESCKDDMPEDEVGLSGWGFCNLSTINGKTITSEEDFYERCAAAAFIGTLQASFTNFPYLGHVTELIARKEALLGVSINGMQHHPKILLNPEIQQKGAEIVKNTNKKYASVLNINPAARTTCVKPEGNSAALLGSTSGIHPDHSGRYFRIVQANQLESPYQYFKSINPQACEESVWSSNKTDDCIRFCVQTQKGTVLKEEIDAISMLDNVVSTYKNWVVSGKNPELCIRKELNHNVSNTIHVQDNEWDKVKDYIYDHRADLAGISLIAATGDKDYNQAPFTAVYSIEEQIKNWGFEATSSAYEIYPKFSEYNFKSLWDACSCVLGYFEPKDEKQEEWKKLIKTYSDRCFSSNIKYATYALKDAYNLDLWNKLIDSYSEVNYLNVLEEKSTINIQGELACAGGACLV